MKKAFLFLLIVICSSCAKDHNKLSANLEYLSVEREGNFTLYDIRYRSDVNLLDLYGRGEGEGAASTMFQCALGDDQDFSVENRLRLSAYGLIRAEDPKQTGGKFNYVTRAFLSEAINNGSSQRTLSVGELNSVLSDRQNIPCKVVITAYGYKPYYSNTMYIPVVDLLREINKPR